MRLSYGGVNDPGLVLFVLGQVTSGMLYCPRLPQTLENQVRGALPQKAFILLARLG